MSSIKDHDIESCVPKTKTSNPKKEATYKVAFFFATTGTSMKVNIKIWLFAMLCLSGCSATDEPNRPITTCGNDAIDAPEQCDGDRLNDQTCQTLGFAGGVLKCHPDICQFVTSGCLNDTTTCGDGTRQANEQCDGQDTTTCPDGSTRACLNNCTLAPCAPVDMIDDMDDMTRDMNDMSPDLQSDMPTDMSGCAHQGGIMGVCGEARDDGTGQCVAPDYEDDERRCDGLDNDCDGLIDEGCAIKKVAVGRESVCKLRQNGVVSCQGNNLRGQSRAPNLLMKDIAAGRHFACGLTKQNGNIICWGEVQFTTSVTKTYDQIVAIDTSMCAIDANKDMDCFGWGGNNAEIFTVPGPVDKLSPYITSQRHEGLLFVSNNTIFKISTATRRVDEHAPGINASSRSALICAQNTQSIWSCQNPTGDETALTRAYEDIVANCGVVSGQLECWPWDNVRNTHDYLNPVQPERFKQKQVVAITGFKRSFDRGQDDICALDTNAQLTCLNDEDNSFHLNIHRAQSIDKLWTHKLKCFSKNKKLQCMGLGFENVNDQNVDWIIGGEGGFINGHMNWICYQPQAGPARCESTRHPEFNTILSDRFKQVTNSRQVACGIKNDDTIKCWGLADKEELAQPPGKYNHVDVSDNVGCAVDEFNKLKCWGKSDSAVLMVPDGDYQSVAVLSFRNACAIDSRQQVKCWGQSNNVTSLTPSTPMRQLSAGVQHVCGLDPQGNIICWGSDRYGESSPPPGTYEDISCGDSNCCARNRAGAMTCWGSLSY